MDYATASNRLNPKHTIPEPRDGMLRRQRLVDFLHEHIDQPLQLICAPAGYGKTTLLADFARDTDLTVSWYTVDELDRDPRSFLRNIIEAIRTRFPNFGASLDSPDGQSQSLSTGWEDLTNRLIEEIRESISDYFVLVIDDFHILASSQDVLAAVDLLIQRLPDNCRLILSTREIPRLASLPRLIGQRKVVGLGPKELKFTTDEIKALLKRNFDLDVSTEEAERLEHDSEGWITAILLTTHSLWKGLFREVLANRGWNSLLYEYMASEVFTQQPPDVQQFLLYTSICNEFDAELANALTGSDSADRLLKEAESRNLFIIRLEGHHPWYRYHPLFRDFLREKLKKESQAVFVGLHVRAADYYLSIGEPRQAIHYYIQGGEFQKALDLLEAQAEPLSREGLWDTLGNWLEQVPAEYRSMRPRLLLYLATVYQRHGRHDEAIRLLSGIIEAFQAQGQHNLQAQALMRRSAALQAKGALQMAVRDSREALLLAQKHCPPTVQAEARIHLGRTYAKQGKYPRAEREFRLALESYQEQGDLFQLSHIHKLLGTVYVELGNFSRATTHLELARQGWKKLGNQSELAATLNNMAWLYYEQGRLEDADPLARESIGLASAANSKRDEAYSLWTLADIQREQEAYGAALESYQRALALARECMETPLVSSCTIGMGETYRLMGDTARAKSLLKEGMDFAYSLGQDFELGMAFMGLGVMECESQDYEQSLVFLLRACTLLARAKQKRNLARARFLLAHTYFQSRKYTDALEQLEAVAELCGELGHDRFLVPDARRAVLMVQYAAIQAKHKDFFARLRDQASLRPSEAPAQVASAPAPRPPKVEVQTFGPLRILLDGTHLLSTAWGSAKAREMFLFMLYNRQPLHKEKIVESLWPQISSAKANSNFHSTLHRMKSALYPNCVDRDGELYQLNPGWSYWLDAHEFERLLQEAEQLSAEEAAEKERLLMAAIDLYKGPFLADTDAEWANAARAGLEFKFWKAEIGLAEQLKARGELRQSITLLEKALAIDELQEDVYYKVMDLYLELGDTAAATKIYKRCLAVFGQTVPLFSSPKVSKLLAHLN